MYTVEDFILGLQKIWPNLIVSRKDDWIEMVQTVYHLSDSETVEYETVAEIPLAELDVAMENLPQDWNMKELYVYNEDFCEVFVQLDSTRGPSYRYLERGYCPVDSNGYTFLLSKASISYAILLICSCATNADINIKELSPVRYFSSGRAQNSLDDLMLSLRWMTIKATAPTKTSLSEYRKMIHSYLFNICYNTSLIFTIPDIHSTRQPRRRSTHREGQLFPYKQYNQSLVKYYYQGLSSDIPFAQYLAFYHVAEFFFQTVAEDDAFKEIEEFITHPSFSPRKKDDIRKFYNKVRQIMRTQKENDVWDEKVGFILCLKKYIPDLEVLKDAINAIDPFALEYYKTTEVPFSDTGCTVNFDVTYENIYANVRNRVYSVRNAIVHSKEGERLKYEPFRHDKDLTREIPLIRAIAEEIIIKSSKPIDIRFSVDG